MWQTRVHFGIYSSGWWPVNPARQNHSLRVCHGWRDQEDLKHRSWHPDLPSRGALCIALCCSDGNFMLLGASFCRAGRRTGELSDPCESQTQESTAAKWKGDRRNLEKQTMCANVSLLKRSHPLTHSPITIWRSISTGCQSQGDKQSTVLLLSSTSLIYFCCDVIPFTFHFTQQEGAYAIFIRSWALLHGLFSGTINQCISLHCRLFCFFPTSLWNVLLHMDVNCFGCQGTPYFFCL